MAKPVKSVYLDQVARMVLVLFQSPTSVFCQLLAIAFVSSSVPAHGFPFESSQNHKLSLGTCTAVGLSRALCGACQVTQRERAGKALRGRCEASLLGNGCGLSTMVSSESKPTLTSQSEERLPTRVKATVESVAGAPENRTPGRVALCCCPSGPQDFSRGVVPGSKGGFKIGWGGSRPRLGADALGADAAEAGTPAFFLSQNSAVARMHASLKSPRPPGSLLKSGSTRLSPKQHDLFVGKAEWLGASDLTFCLFSSTMSFLSLIFVFNLA